MSLVIKKASHTRASTTKIFRGIAKLSDGKFAVLTFNSNIAGKSGSSSENNNIPKLYLTVYNSNWTTFLTTSIQTGTANTKQYLGAIASMAVDSSNNIHIVYNYRTSPQTSTLLSQGQTLRYRKVTYNGTTLAVGAETTIYSTAGYYSGVDIEVPLGTAVASNPLIAFTHSTNGTTFVTRLTQVAGLQTTQIESVTSGGRGVSLALNNTADDTSYKWLATTYQISPGADVGDTIIWGTGTTSSAPVSTATLAQNLNVGLGSGMRHLAVFRTGDAFIITGPVAVNPYVHFFAAYSIPVATATTILLSPTNFNIGGKYVANSGYLFAGEQIDPSHTAIISHISDGKNIYAQLFTYTLSSVLTVTPVATKWKMDQYYLGKNIAPALIYSGDRARNGTTEIGCVVDYPEAYLYVLYDRDPDPGKITAALTNPASNGIINKSNPTVTVQVTGSANYNIVGRVQLQTAKDAGYTTEVSNFYSAYSTFLKSTAVKMTLPAGVLGQGVFFSRVRIVDQLGFAYGWNADQKFTVTHKPTASIISPARGAVAVYNADDTVTIKIGFSDPDSTDSQSAYRIQITDLSGTVLADTTKVVSAANSVNIALGSGNLNADLLINAWVWDEDDVMSDPVNSDFKLAQLPVVAWDSPVNNTAITTATPTYSWINTLPVGRTQVFYRVVTRRADNAVIVWDSGKLSGDADTLIQPAGYLKNDTNYTSTVWIQDNLGMTASAPVTFPTSWNKPVACPAPYVDLSLYSDLGFAYVTLVPPSGLSAGDLPNIKIALMRRSLFSNTDWEQVAELQMGTGLNYSVIDSTLPTGVKTYYAAVLKVDAGGDVSIGDPNASIATSVDPSVGAYWLVSSNDPTLNTSISPVTSDSFTEEKEQEVVVIANRGRWVDQGEAIGASGTITARIYNRDFSLGGNPLINYIKNPKLISTGTGSNGIPNWTFANSSYITRRTYSPSPSVKDTCVALGQTAAADASISQTIAANPGAYNFGALIENSYIVTAAGKSVALTAVCKDTGGSTLGTFNQNYTLTVSGSALVPSGATAFSSPIGPQFSWYRLNCSFTAPANTASIVLTISLNGDAGDYLTIGGAILIDSLDTSVRYFDGSFPGAEWMSSADTLNSASFTSGKITARAARRRLKKISESSDTFYLRNPYGDVFKVSTGDISVDRIAGTGADEFVEVSIPYLELK